MKDKLYMNIAERIAQESHAERAKIGAVLVKDNNIISMGYNGTPSGMDNTCEIDGITKKEVLHAESNAILKCAKSTLSSEGTTLYCLYSPCIECAKLIIQAGIVRVVYKQQYRDISGLNLLKAANIKLQII